MTATRAQFREAFIEEVRAATDIVEVIGEHVALKRRGRDWWGLCPFHVEKTPSFSVSAEKQMFYCFGCQTGGNVFTFLMKKEGLEFGEALRLLADRAGIPLPKADLDPEARRRQEQREQLTRLLEAAVEFYVKQLEQAGGRQARAYLARRGLEPETVARFRLGYAPDAWDGCLEALGRRGWSPEMLAQAGLVVETTDARGERRYYDRFRHRLMFPIFDLTGRPIGFGGRVLEGAEPEQPKYVNSPEGPVFSKGRNLYGLNWARDGIRRAGHAVITEGYTDVITAHQAGFTHLVASLGTALTTQQARLLLRYCREVVTAFDADTAGQEATLRGLEVLKQTGLRVRVAMLPDGKDPDDCIRSFGPDAFGRALENAVPLVEYRFRRAMERQDTSTVQGKVRVAGEVVPVLAGLESAVEREEYLKRFARELGVDPEALRTEVEKARRGQARGQGRGRPGAGRWKIPAGTDKLAVYRHNKEEKGNDGKKLGVYRAEQQLLGLMATDPGVARRVAEAVGADGFSDPAHRKVAAALFAWANAGGAEGVRPALLEDDEAAQALARATFSFVEPPDRDRLLEDLLARVEAARRYKRIEELEGMMRERERRGEPVPSELLRELADLVRSAKGRGQPARGPGAEKR